MAVVRETFSENRFGFLRIYRVTEGATISDLPICEQPPESPYISLTGKILTETGDEAITTEDNIFGFELE